MSWLYLRDDCVLISRSWNLHHIMIKNIIMGVTIKVMLVSTSWNKSSFRWQMRTMEDYEKDRQDINVEIWSKTVCIPCSPRFPPRPAPPPLSFSNKRDSITCGPFFKSRPRVVDEITSLMLLKICGVWCILT